MGEIADMVIEGHLCQECLCLIEEGDACGYPRFCRDCGGDPECNFAAKRKTSRRRKDRRKHRQRGK